MEYIRWGYGVAGWVTMGVCIYASTPSRVIARARQEGNDVSERNDESPAVSDGDKSGAAMSARKCEYINTGHHVPATHSRATRRGKVMDTVNRAYICAVHADLARKMGENANVDFDIRKEA